MKRYEIIKSQKEISYKNRKSIKAGCTLDDACMETISSFKNLKDAKAAFEGLKSDIWELKGNTGFLYLITEYVIQCNEYDVDGEFITSGDILEISTMRIDVVNSESLEIMASFDNMADVEDYIDNHIDDMEMYLSFC